MLSSLGIAALFTASALQAQIGLASAPARITLVVHSEPRAMISSVGAPALQSSEGALRELSVPVKLSANTGYRLLVVGSYPGGNGARISVRAEDGEFQALQPGRPVPVARGNHTGGEIAVEVFYRVESGGMDDAGTLPVRYEIVMAPRL